MVNECHLAQSVIVTIVVISLETEWCVMLLHRRACVDVGQDWCVNVLISRQHWVIQVKGLLYYIIHDFLVN